MSTRKPKLNFEQLKVSKPTVGPAAKTVLEDIDKNNTVLDQEGSTKENAVLQESDLENILGVRKKASFLDTYRQDTFYIEKDLYATLRSLTTGVRAARVKLINTALREFFENHNVEIIKYTSEYDVAKRKKS